MAQVPLLSPSVEMVKASKGKSIMSFIARIELKYQIQASNNSHWFDNSPPITKSESLNQVIKKIYTANKTQNQLEEEVKKKGEQLYTDFSDDPRVGSLCWYKDPKILTDVRISHFTNLDPNRLIQEIKKGNFKSNETDWFWNFTDPKHQIGYGYLKGRKEQHDTWGKHQIEFTASVAIEFYHMADDEYQVIFDPLFISDFKIIK